MFVRGALPFFFLILRVWGGANEGNSFTRATPLLWVVFYSPTCYLRPSLPLSPSCGCRRHWRKSRKFSPTTAGLTSKVRIAFGMFCRHGWGIEAFYHSRAWMVGHRWCQHGPRHPSASRWRSPLFNWSQRPGETFWSSLLNSTSIWYTSNLDLCPIVRLSAGSGPGCK